ncbi:anthranilate synthase component I family protein [Asticcacaulis sp. SL142]|uniref:anthranilate synthase component I family protein n=1 Tax=Asticcacaulis sp. SL142 TaxID=2995155 RepID=UPI00226D04A9|nr:anthranilate synthase component I family protein [Asticcacaulis sp. SL142]WAC47703.1 anthranilate synthase component I family protein [Asticcacaulis sp. SL142]
MSAFATPLTHLHVIRLPFVAPETLFEAWFETDHSVGLISDGGPQGRWSYLGCYPDGVTTLEFEDDTDPKTLLKQAIAPFKAAPQPAHISGDAVTDLPPFTGGVIALASFEMGMRFEALKKRPFRVEGRKAWPELHILRYPAVLAFDHRTRTLLSLGRGRDDYAARNAADTMRKAFNAALKHPATGLIRNGPLVCAPLTLETADEVHEGKVASLIQQIHAGDLFQANLARGWQGTLKDDVTLGRVLRDLNRAGPAPFGAALRLKGRAIISNSPERFISLSPDGHLETRPIKGTRPRGATPAADKTLSDALLKSPKDRAENLMIVDLMRHDLSKVSEVGSVKVTALNALETYPSVHHLVSTVTGQLSPGLDAADVICATFPPGSISGAPKVQALKVIQELEAPRGPYCGSLMVIDAEGGMDSSVLIRTIALEKDDHSVWHLRVCAGGGIVADSDPHDERIETETKLKLIRSVLEGTT